MSKYSFTNEKQIKYIWNVKNKKTDEVLKLSMRERILYEKKVQEMENIHEKRNHRKEKKVLHQIP